MRIYQLVRGLAEHHDVTCLSFAPDAAAERAMAPLQRICRVVTVRGPDGRSLRRRAWTTLASPLPDMALRNASSPYTQALRALLATERFDIVQGESIEMAGYLLEVVSAEHNVLNSNRHHSSKLKTQNPKLVLDQFNTEYLLQKRAALQSLRAAFPPSLRNPQASLQSLAAGMYSIVQWRKLAGYEARVMRRCDLVLAVAAEDGDALRTLAPGTSVGVVPNGVDSGFFSRAAMARERAGPIVLGDATLVFSGTLDFRPNVDAVTWFARAVLPLLRARRPETRLLVVGKRPAPALRELAAAGLIVLTGEVPDARPYIAGMVFGGDQEAYGQARAVYVVPMRIGGGVRLKLLEAFALEAPVVSTTMGAEGVAGLRSGEHCLLADDPAEFAAAVLRLLDDRTLCRQLGAAGRSLVRERYDWQVIVPRLEALYAGTQVAR
jgi:polysaccharide biosynthesis protein PslH